MPGEHRVGRTRKRDVAGDDRAPHLAIDACGAEFFELIVQIEDQRGPLETARGPAHARMEADNEEGLAAETQRKMRIVGVFADARVGGWPAQSSLCVSDSSRSHRHVSNPASSNPLSSSNKTASE